jgi:hypothetical protein
VDLDFGCLTVRHFSGRTLQCDWMQDPRQIKDYFRP